MPRASPIEGLITIISSERLKYQTEHRGCSSMRLTSCEVTELKVSPSKHHVSSQWVGQWWLSVGRLVIFGSGYVQSSIYIFTTILLARWN
jgi:hypothetical protein